MSLKRRGKVNLKNTGFDQGDGTASIHASNQNPIPMVIHSTADQPIVGAPFQNRTNSTKPNSVGKNPRIGEQVNKHSS